MLTRLCYSNTVLIAKLVNGLRFAPFPLAFRRLRGDNMLPILGSLLDEFGVSLFSERNTLATSRADAKEDTLFSFLRC